IRLYYDVIDKKGNLLMSQNCHVCSVIELKSGKSVVFGIPYTELDDAGSVRVQFAFPWEDNAVVGPATEPKHFVYFYIRDLLSGTSRIVPELRRKK
ncbi:MAG: hypothetical protein ABIV48_09450, partial [Pyrinomonadaceae bacterium]